MGCVPWVVPAGRLASSLNSRGDRRAEAALGKETQPDLRRPSASCFLRRNKTWPVAQGSLKSEHRALQRHPERPVWAVQQRGGGRARASGAAGSPARSPWVEGSGGGVDQPCLSGGTWSPGSGPGGSGRVRAPWSSRYPRPPIPTAAHLLGLSASETLVFFRSLKSPLNVCYSGFYMLSHFLPVVLTLHFLFPTCSASRSCRHPRETRSPRTEGVWVALKPGATGSPVGSSGRGCAPAVPGAALMLRVRSSVTSEKRLCGL